MVTTYITQMYRELIKYVLGRNIMDIHKYNIQEFPYPAVAL